MIRKPKESVRHAVPALRGAKVRAKVAARREVNLLRPRLVASHQAAVQMCPFVGFICKANVIKVTNAICITSLCANSLRMDLAKKVVSVNSCILDQRLLLQPRIPLPAATKTTRSKRTKRNQSHRQKVEEELPRLS
jgi:hypothetical protein